MTNANLAGKSIADLSFDELKTMGLKAGSEAAKRALTAGVPVAEIRDDQVICKHPDGRRENLGTIASAKPS